MEREESEEWSLLTTGQGSGLLGSAGSPDRKLELNKAGTLRGQPGQSLCGQIKRENFRREEEQRTGQVRSSWLSWLSGVVPSLAKSSRQL